MTALHDWWQARNPRERVMVTIMLVAVAAFVLWYGAIAPLRQARDAAQARYLRAAAALQEIDAAAAAIAAARGQRPPPPQGEAFAAAIVDSAGAAGIAVGRRQAGDGVFEIGIDGVPATALFAWLDTLRARHGIAPQRLRIDKHDGRLRAELAFAPAPR